MTLEFIFASEGFLAHGAGVRLLPGVDHHVPLLFVTPGERLPAFLTGVRTVHEVSFVVTLEVKFVVELLVADVANKSLDVRVFSLDMSVEEEEAAERLAASLALVSLFRLRLRPGAFDPVVSIQMSFKVPVAGKLFRAPFTFVIFLFGS